MERMPKHKHDAFLDDYVSIVSSMQLAIDDVESDFKQFLSPYKLMIAYARK